MSGSLCCSLSAPYPPSPPHPPPPPPLKETSEHDPHPHPTKGSQLSQLQVTAERQMFDSEHAQGFCQCNLKVHGVCASVV